MLSLSTSSECPLNSRAVLVWQERYYQHFARAAYGSLQHPKMAVRKWWGARELWTFPLARIASRDSVRDLSAHVVSNLHWENRHTCGAIACIGSIWEGQGRLTRTLPTHNEAFARELIIDIAALFLS